MRNAGTTSSLVPDSGAGQGLRGMRERAEAFGGAVTASPGPEGGFTVRLELPVAGASTLEAAQ
jgi:signal transduction histidine kinase